MQRNLPYERGRLTFFFCEISLGGERKGAENLIKFEKFSEVSGGGQVVVVQPEADSREIILKNKKN